MKSRNPTSISQPLSSFYVFPSLYFSYTYSFHSFIRENIHFTFQFLKMFPVCYIFIMVKNI